VTLHGPGADDAGDLPRVGMETELLAVYVVRQGIKGTVR